MHGNRITTEIVFFHTSSGTVLFADVLQQFPPRWFSGWRAALAKWDLMLEPEPSVPRRFGLRSPIGAQRRRLSHAFSRGRQERCLWRIDVSSARASAGVAPVSARGFRLPAS